MDETKTVKNQFVVDTRAKAFVDARLECRALPHYPGEPPTDLEDAYRIQDQAISLWPDEIAGWKVARIAERWQPELAADRLAGPVFRRASSDYTGTSLEIPVFDGGFAAVEGEYIVVIGADAPQKTSFTAEETLAMVGALHIGFEIAGSPYAQINDHGPIVTISDFSNNCGVVVGPELVGEDRLAFDTRPFTVIVNGQTVGEATPDSAGGPLASLRFILEHAARRGHPLKKGMRILTGAITGVHQVSSGDTARLHVQGAGSIDCSFVSAQAR